MTQRIKGYGWKPDAPDSRDRIAQPITESTKQLPPAISLAALFPPCYDQGEEGSCTANAIAAEIEYQLSREGISFKPSRNFIYWNERALEQTTREDGGAQIRDGIKVVASIGVCSETDWPYDPSRVIGEPGLPSPLAYTNARDHIIKEYRRVGQTEHSVCDRLASGKGVIFGFQAYESFESDTVATTGVLNLPAYLERPIGGHAVVIVGYNRQSRRFICRNSWGPVWGLDGHFTMSFDYVLNRNLASDFWSIDAA